MCFVPVHVYFCLYNFIDVYKGYNDTVQWVMSASKGIGLVACSLYVALSHMVNRLATVLKIVLCSVTLVKGNQYWVVY